MHIKFHQDISISYRDVHFLTQKAARQKISVFWTYVYKYILFFLILRYRIIKIFSLISRYFPFLLVILSVVIVIPNTLQLHLIFIFSAHCQSCINSSPSMEFRDKKFTGKLKWLLFPHQQTGKKNSES